METPGKYDFKYYAFGHQKDSPYADMFDYHIEKMRESGLLQSIKAKYQGLPQMCPNLRWGTKDNDIFKTTD